MNVRRLAAALVAAFLMGLGFAAPTWAEQTPLPTPSEPSETPSEPEQPEPSETPSEPEPEPSETPSEPEPEPSEPEPTDTAEPTEEPEPVACGDFASRDDMEAHLDEFTDPEMQEAELSRLDTDDDGVPCEQLDDPDDTPADEAEPASEEELPRTGTPWLLAAVGTGALALGGGLAELRRRFFGGGSHG